jgi:CubicO group peptidase (beta-lactamase class C family)
MRLAAILQVTAVIAVLAGCSGPAPAPPATPTAGELAAAVDRFLDESLSPGILNRRAILVAVDGELMVERYYDSSARETAAVASVTKSVVSTLVGIAVSEGYLSLDQSLSELLPSYSSLMTSSIGGITLRQLLTMTAGLPPDNRSDLRPSGRDWVADILRRGTVQAPGAGFAYSSVSSHLLAAILVEATGQSLLTYARAKLFDPLEIDTRPAFQPIHAPGRPDPVRAYDRAGFAWPRDPQGVHVGYGELKMTAADMLKLGNLYLDQGRWDGEQLVPSGWIRDATTSAVSTAGDFGGTGYGYQWWVTSAGEHPAFAAVGYGGQIIEVVPDLELVVVASTRFDDDTVTFDSRIWQTMTSMALVPDFEPDAN